MIKCYNRRVIVKDFVIEEKKVSILIIPKEKELLTARVVAFGSDVDSKLSVGDVLYFRPYSGTMVEIEGDSYRSIDESEIVAAWGVDG